MYILGKITQLYISWLTQCSSAERVKISTGLEVFLTNGPMVLYPRKHKSWVVFVLGVGLVFRWSQIQVELLFSPGTYLVGELLQNHLVMFFRYPRLDHVAQVSQHRHEGKLLMIWNVYMFYDRL